MLYAPFSDVFEPFGNSTVYGSTLGSLQFSTVGHGGDFDLQDKRRYPAENPCSFGLGGQGRL
jgi:hypothetical protein